ncbi:UPF0496 protein 1-like [Dioscorea cayenensis subsp. rotundata]|uniref:UPF0496 protein 1-like n=1 Tax=Dioscorea cayennensis subsp. rotundata TaxID=55577 RepID=A0AB40BNW9_DIOCR|nr:UPF0496 protein 1-like [Dioscorea cayenensis subsp. rotundata]
MGCITSTTINPADYSPAVRRSMGRAISTVTTDAATLHSLSFTALQAATSALVDVERDAFDNIVQLKDEISANPDLLFIVEHYLESSIHALRFFTVLKYSLSKARENELLVRDALLLFEEGQDLSATLEKLQEFKDEGDPFTENFFNEFKLVCEHQQSILHELLLRKQVLDEKLRKVTAWRKVWHIIYSAVFAAVLICSAVLAAMSMPSAVMTVASAASSAMEQLKQWVDSVWERFQKSYEEERRVIQSLGKGTLIAIHELNSMKSLVEDLEEKIRYLIHNADVDPTWRL